MNYEMIWLTSMAQIKYSKMNRLILLSLFVFSFSLQIRSQAVSYSVLITTKGRKAGGCCIKQAVRQNLFFSPDLFYSPGG
jgi:hypothetical protein